MLAALPLTPDSPFTSLSACIRAHATARPSDEALVDAHWRLTWQALDTAMDGVVARFRAAGLQPGAVVALLAPSTVPSAVFFLGALRAGAVVAPISTSLSAEVLHTLLNDAQPQWLAHAELPDTLRCAIQAWRAAADPTGCRVGWTSLSEEPFPPSPLALDSPDWTPTLESPFNIIYSSGTTGTPKGIVQSHGMRWAHIRRGMALGYGPSSRTLLSTPLYSNTTLVAFLPTLGLGGCVHLMSKFDAADWLRRAQAERITHTMLVPVQYQRLLDHPDFDHTDLSAFEMKFCTSAPFSAALKSEVLQRWPGGLVEFYGMTEGGGTCILEAHRFPHKLHTVGPPSTGHDIRLIDEDGREIDRSAHPDALGEVVGRSPGMMTGYHRRPEATRAAEWWDAQGQRFIRTGDVGRFDADGFLVLMDRRKDLIISGGFNIYPSDLEALLCQHPGVADVAVVGVPSRRWGETPVAWVVRQPATDGMPPLEAEALREWFNTRCTALQRLAGVEFVEELPRSSIGKVLKRELRERWTHPVP